MTAATIEYVDSTINSALEADYLCGPKPEVEQAIMAKRASKQSGTLYGFPIDSDVLAVEAKNKMLEERRKKIDAYRNDAQAMRGSLMSVGIQPKAIITPAAFDKIMADAGLYAVFPDADGDAYMKIDLAARIRGPSAPGASNTCMALIMLSVSLCAALPFYFSWGSTNEATLGLAAGLGIAGFMGSAITLFEIERRLRGRRAMRRAKEYIATHTWADFVRDASWANRTFATNSYSDTCQVRVVFPPAPAEITDKLRKLYDLNRGSHSLACVGVAVEPAAFAIRGGPSAYFKAGFDELTRLENDPIIFVRRQSSVAIIDQFGGEFPAEREAIDAIANSEHLL